LIAANGADEFRLNVARACHCVYAALAVAVFCDIVRAHFVFRLLTAQICHAFNGLDSPRCHASIEPLVVQAQSDSSTNAEHFHQAGATVAQSGGNRLWDRCSLDLCPTTCTQFKFAYICQEVRAPCLYELA